jgi:hypothetical protein
MNWTGGRLHRHIKANTNEQVKTQKHHFAKARQEVQQPRSIPQPTLSILGQFQPAPTSTASNPNHEFNGITSNARVGFSKARDAVPVGGNSRVQGSNLAASIQDPRQALHTLSRASLTCAAGRTKKPTLSSTLSMTFLPVQIGLVSQ